ncbi:MAG: hypothetical protein AAGF12_14980 [Myxococcota bacterium]
MSFLSSYVSRFLFLLLVPALGCMSDDDCPEDPPLQDGGTDSTPDALPDANADAAPDRDVGPVATLRVRNSMGDDFAPDLRCLGERVEPAAGASTTIAGPVLAFGERDMMGMPVAIPTAELQVFINNQPSGDGTCIEPSCFSVTANNEGLFAFEVAEEAWFAYRSVGGDGFLPTTEQYVTVPGPGEPTFFNSIRGQTLAGIARLVGAEVAPGTALVAGRIADCTGTGFIRNARLEVAAADGTVLAPGDNALIAYFNDEGSAPDLARTGTNWDGRFSVLNLPADGSVVQIRLYGQQTRESEEELIGCELVSVYGDGMANLRVLPLRADGPDCR